MITNPIRRNKISLSDYPYQKDIEYRLLMADLSVFEADVLTEIIHGSLETDVDTLADYLEVDQAKILPTLEKLQMMKLFKLQNGSIFVDKEMRKYYESQIDKFDDDFRPDMEFLRSLLSKVTIHVLPIWYSIPRTSDDIFASIIEKYLQTPKIYQRYLDDLTFDEPFLNDIMREVYSAPDLKVRAKELIRKYDLSREQFEECMLLLEFNLVCCLTYQKRNNKWEEVLTPYYEWEQYQTFIRESAPQSISEPLKVKRTHSNDFGFVQDLVSVLTEVIKKPVKEEKILKDYQSAIVDRLELLKLVEIKEGVLHPKSVSDSWIEKHLQEQAMYIYRYASHQRTPVPGGYIDRDLRETEKCLKRVMSSGWIYFDDFIKGCTAPLGENQPVSLQKKGRRWRYQLPEFTKEDIQTIYRHLFENLFQAGMVATGTHDGKPCFCVTPFGRMTID